MNNIQNPGEDNEPNFSPNETPERNDADSTREGEYSGEEPTRPDTSQSDANYSEQNDVTPPEPHEFPSVGHAKTDFETRNHGRTTGRMVGHEPGTEGI
ncbi:hypothetical protein [Mucilaginibacter ginkgonis]|uniref:Uncharacterized protein n=1 Tax=Mucilaginibacter ginkgonis TaxID=2682091 RepID=A0A6I4I6T5_9SPHI|nr:hypothetical protein [Mucilaginibacter ginkgonis]QQL50786.1 hypothetical protein GO620_004835 [Mucilaginibacter ginkgonis]